jgi:hypothetical protein
MFVPTLLLASVAFTAGNGLACYEEPGTRKMSCIMERGVRSNGDLRASYLYTGGPKGVEKTSYLVIADCKRKVMTLQDSSGVNFGGGLFSATKMSSALSQWLCEAKKLKPDRSLKQFD